MTGLMMTSFRKLRAKQRHSWPAYISRTLEGNSEPRETKTPLTGVLVKNTKYNVNSKTVFFTNPLENANNENLFSLTLIVIY